MVRIWVICRGDNIALGHDLKYQTVGSTDGRVNCLIRDEIERKLSMELAGAY